MSERKKCKHMAWRRKGISDEVESCFHCGASVREMLEDFIFMRARFEGVIEALEENGAHPELTEFIKDQVFKGEV